MEIVNIAEHVDIVVKKDIFITLISKTTEKLTFYFINFISNGLSKSTANYGRWQILSYL